MFLASFTLLIAYGGLLAMNFRAGETLLVSGATGNFGSATVATALAMGARSVVAPGRNEAVLSDLKRRFGDRLVPVRLVGDAGYDNPICHTRRGQIIKRFLGDQSRQKATRRRDTDKSQIWPELFRISRFGHKVVEMR
jgi:hypothetical protein